MHGRVEEEWWEEENDRRIYRMKQEEGLVTFQQPVVLV